MFAASLVYRATSKIILGNEGKYQADEDEIEQGGNVLAPASNRTWLLLPCGFGVKDRRKEIWNLPLKQIKDAEDRHISGLFPNEGQ